MPALFHIDADIAVSDASAFMSQRRHGFRPGDTHPFEDGSPRFPKRVEADVSQPGRLTHRGMPVARQLRMLEGRALARGEDQVHLLPSLTFEQLRFCLPFPVIAQSVQKHTRDGYLGFTAFRLRGRETVVTALRLSYEIQPLVPIEIAPLHRPQLAV